jgi:hypothetical protein
MVGYARHRRLGGVLVFVALIAVAAPAAGQSAGAPVAEFEVVWRDVLSMSQAPADDAQQLWLRGRGVATVVILDEAMIDTGRHGFDSFLWVALPAGMPPTAVQAERFLKFIQQPDNQPVHISSSVRETRALMVALLRYAVDGWSLDNALREAQRLNGGSALPALLAQWLQTWAVPRPPGSHRRLPA